MSWMATFIGAGVSPHVFWGVISAAYAMGCFNTGYYMVRLRTGQDVRLTGSGSTGARNVRRLLGSNGFVLTMVGDLAKGGLAVWLALAMTSNERVAAMALLAVVLGHVWPAQLGFRGGKGVATSLAGLLIYDATVTVVFLILFGLIYVLTRRSVAACLVAYACLPVASFWLQEDSAHILGISVLAGIVILAHHQNMTQGIHELRLRRNVDPEDDESVHKL
jgi:acyl phosphate:glycerol-3-phosphate acyltransferase